MIPPIGPRQVSNTLVISKLFAGILGGFSGTIAILIVIFLSNMVNVETTAFSFFSALIISVIGTLVPNILSILFFSFFDNERYKNIAKILTQIFAFNIIFSILISPLYFIAGQGEGDLDKVILLLTFHLSFSAFITYFIAETISNNKHFLVSIYGSTFALLVILFTNFIILSSLSGETYQTLSLLLAMPIAWGMLGLFSTVAEMTYSGFYHIYGIDFLSSDLDLYADDDDQAS